MLDTVSARRKAPSVQAHSVSLFLPTAFFDDTREERTLPSDKPCQLRDFNRLLRWYAPVDALALITGFLCAWGLATLVNDMFFGRAVADIWNDAFRKLAQFAFISAGVVLWFQHTDHYRMRMPFWLESKKVVSALGFAMMADGFLEFASKHDFSRLWLMLSWIISAALIIGLRSLLRSQFRQSGQFQVRTLLIGAGETAQHTRAALLSEPGFGYEITAQIKELSIAFLKAGKSWKKLYAMYDVDHIIVALDGHDLASAERPLAQLARESLPFTVSPPLRHMPVFGMVPQYCFNHDVMLMTRSNGLEQPLHCLIKRVLDVLLSGTALFILSPVMLAIAWMVRRDGGPALYGHSRIGRDGRSFSCMKFRSMVRNSDEVLKEYLAQNAAARAEWQADRKLRRDPRVTGLGRFLRKSSLDELPQLINVLRGDMSLVGPRPIVTDEVIHYGGDIAHYYRVRPGITGLWQVSGRNDVSYLQRVHMDSWYVRNWSLWHDIAIICKTFPALLKRSGAY